MNIISSASCTGTGEERPSISSPSYTRSPHKRPASIARSLSPLLSQARSTTPLEALEASNLPDSASQHDFYRLTAAATPSERALAVRAASAATSLEQWYQELQQWQWPDSPNGFEASDEKNAAHNPSQDWSSPSSEDTRNVNAPTKEYWGSLLAQTAMAYETRIEEIREGMDALEFNELKMHVRDVHLASLSESSTNSNMVEHKSPTSGYNHMDDFTAAVTTTIMQALPIIYRVETLLNSWEVRLSVLRAVPGFRTATSQTKEAMSTAWKTLESSARGALDYNVDDPDGNVAGKGLRTYAGQERDLGRWPQLLNIKAELERQIRDLGQRLDFLLDTLEARQDTIPDAWIDDMEHLEAEFGDWVVEAEKMAVNWDLDQLKSHQRPEQVLYAPIGNAIETGEFDHRTADIKPVAIDSTAGTDDIPTSALDKPLSRISPPPSIEAASRNDYVGTLASSSPRMQIRGSEALDGSSSVPDLVIDTTSNSPDSVASKQQLNLQTHGHRPSPLNLTHHRSHSNALSDFSSDSSYLGSAASEYFSNLSSPEIHDASKTEYFGVGSPVEVTTPGLPRRESRASEETVTRQSSQRTERGDRPLSAIASPSRSRASTVVSEPPISEDPGSTTFAAKKDRRSLPNFAFRNDIPDGDIREFATPEDPEPTPPMPNQSRHRFENFTDLSPGNTPVKIIRRKTEDAFSIPTTPHAKKIRTPNASPARNTEEELEARITSILTGIPVNIELARDSPSTDRMSQSAANRAARLIKRKSTPRLRLMRSQTAVPSPPTMTLTPAKHRSTGGDPEIKLYHLHQPGKEAPIKLFVRLVGEGGERVMVRIGGGWADLAEYLTEYAIHHGRRTVSDGRFDIQGLPHSQSSSPVPTLGSLSHAQTPKSRPESPIASRSTSGAASQSRRFSIGTPGSPLTSGGARSSPDDFRPTSRESNASSKRSWLGDDSPSLGLAGPKGRKATVSPNKQAWVDTMMEKARTGSNEKQRSSRNAFGDLGIMGGTKRLFMKAEKK